MLRAEQVQTSAASKQRREARVAPNSLTYVQFGSKDAGIVVDFSEHGLLLATSLSLVTEFIPRIHIQVDEPAGGVTVSGRTVWTDASTHRAGIEVVDVTERDRSRIQAWVRSEMARSSLPGPYANQRKIVSSHSEAVAREFEGGEILENDDFIAEVREVIQKQPDILRPGFIQRNRRSVEVVTVLAATACVALAIYSEAKAGWPLRQKFERAHNRPTDGAPASNVLAPAASNATSDRAHTPDRAHTMNGTSDTPANATRPAEALPPPVTLWISPAKNTLIKLPNHKVLQSDALAITSQSSMYIARTPGSASQKELLIVGRLISHIDPEAPAAATSVPGAKTVRLRATVGSKGEVVAVTPISGPAQLFPGVLSAVREWRFEPTLLDGRPIDMQVDLTITFHPPGDTDRDT